MSVKLRVKQAVMLSVLAVSLSSCFHPPYNNFQEDKQTIKSTAFGAAYGATIGTILGTAAGSAGAGAVVGGIAGPFIGYQKTRKPALLQNLQKDGIEYVQYGDTQTLLIPTDQYYVFDTPKLNDLEYPGLINIVRLLKLNKPLDKTPIYVAAFTDDVGSKAHKKKLSQARAEAMVTFLWANDIPAKLFHAEGYGDKNTIGNNKTIRGSAYNRRVEIQWLNPASHRPKRLAFYRGTK